MIKTDQSNRVDIIKGRDDYLHLVMFQKYEVREYDGEKALLMVQTADEVLDYREAVDKLSRAEMVIEKGDDHGFTGFERHFQMIVEFLSYLRVS